MTEGSPRTGQEVWLAFGPGAGGAATVPAHTRRRRGHGKRGGARANPPHPLELSPSSGTSWPSVAVTAVYQGMTSIPACAGNTTTILVRKHRVPVDPCVLVHPPVHPRVRGEHPGGFDSAPRGPRSIPACAGNTQCKAPHPRRALRSIPACAGNTRGPGPRNRGAAGPSPRARGTPAAPPRARFRSTVHPRVRGEHDAVAVAQLVRQRSIPACAGNTNWYGSTDNATAVHPRVRGEHPGERFNSRRAARSIPACAGNTLTSASAMQKFSVHPRVRGEHLSYFATRGGTTRSIPACAGNTTSA